LAGNPRYPLKKKRGCEFDWCAAGSNITAGKIMAVDGKKRRKSVLAPLAEKLLHYGLLLYCFGAYLRDPLMAA
jgi:hypothetical protein